MAAGNEVIREGRNVGWGVAFCGLFTVFFGLLWVVSRLDLVTLAVDERGMHYTTFWGLLRRSLAWDEIEKVEYDTIVDRMHG